MGSKGVALIVVHGVADQKPGDTARAVVDLLVGTDPGLLAGATYAARSCEDIALAVEPLPPRRAPPRRTDATPRSEDRSLVKSWLQSLRSDFVASMRNGHGPAERVAKGARQTCARGVRMEVRIKQYSAGREDPDHIPGIQAHAPVECKLRTCVRTSAAMSHGWRRRHEPAARCRRSEPGAGVLVVGDR